MKEDYKLVKAVNTDGSYTVLFDFGDKYVYNFSDKTAYTSRTYFKDIKPLEERCTLSDAVERYDIDILCKESGEQLMELNDAEKVEWFKHHDLYKETLKDLRVKAKKYYKNTPISVLRYISELEKLKK